MGDTRGPDLLHMALSCTWMILRLKQPTVGPGPWQSVTQAQECFLCGRAISQGLDCMHSGSLSPMQRWGDSRHRAPSSPCEVASWMRKSVFLSTHLSWVFRAQGWEETSWIQSLCSPLHFKGSHPTDWHSLSQEHQN